MLRDRITRTCNKSQAMAVRVAPTGRNHAELVQKHGFVEARVVARYLEAKAAAENIENLVEVALQREVRASDVARRGTTRGAPKTGDFMERISSVAAQASNSSRGEEELLAVATLRESLTGNMIFPQHQLKTLPLIVGTTLFAQLAPLKRLNIARNDVSALASPALPQFSLRSVRYLTELNLAGNGMQFLPSDLGCLRQLAKLDIANNRLHFLPRSFATLRQLQSLNLSYNEFRQLPDSCGELGALVELDVSHNLLEYLPGTLNRLTKLRQLNLSHNGLAHLACIPQPPNKSTIWRKLVDEYSNCVVYRNIVTARRHSSVPDDGLGFTESDVAKLEELASPNTPAYLRRKHYLGALGIIEWEPKVDCENGWVYYFNNVSGESSWTIPQKLDRIEYLTALRELDLSFNQLRTLPPGVCHCNHLRTLRLANNYISELPEQIGKLQRLERLELSANVICTLPDQLRHCVGLQQLLANDNQLAELPEFISCLTQLKRLVLGSNKISHVPLQLGYLTTLTEVQLYNNPLKHPSPEAFERSLQETLSSCRLEHLNFLRGLPPSIDFHPFGLQYEVLESVPFFEKKLLHLQQHAKKYGMLDLRMLNIDSIPELVQSLDDLQTLYLDHNKLTLQHFSVPQSFSTLQMLSLTHCSLEFFPEQVSVCSGLKVLNVAQNNMEAFPPAILQLRSLEILTLSKNKMYNLHENIGELSNLVELAVSHNRLELLPLSVGFLPRLKHLDASFNTLQRVPPSITQLSTLVDLNIERNQLNALPPGMGNLRVAVLRIGHNRLGELEKDFFLPNLCSSLHLVSLVENNLVELPFSVVDLPNTVTVEAEYNPLISPPSETLSHKFEITQQYYRIRAMRLAEISDKLRHHEFDVDEACAEPVVESFVIGGTGLLTPADLREFDNAVDMYVNADYYRTNANSVEMVEKLVKLRDAREAALYAETIEKLNRLMREVEANDDGGRYAEYSVQKELRALGRDEEMVNCWVMSVTGMFTDLPTEHPIIQDGRECIFSRLKRMIDPMPFDFTHDMLKDALQLSVHPYGPVATSEYFNFPQCDCVDPVTNVPLKHNPCTKHSITFVVSIYSEEEADRRADDEQTVTDALETVNDEIDVWANSFIGKRLIARQVKGRREQKAEQLKVVKKLLKRVQARHHEQREGVNQVKKRLERLNAEAFTNHELHEQLEMLGAKHEVEVDKLGRKVKLLEAERDELLAIQTMKDEKLCEQLVKDMKQKYMFHAYNGLLEDFRRQALAQQKRRPWDGPDGVEYSHWFYYNTHTVDAEARAVMESSGEYTFDGLDDMPKYECAAVTAFNESRRDTTPRFDS